MTISKLIYKPVMLLAAIFCVGLTSCMPGGGEPANGGGSDVEVKPLPGGVEAKAVGLYCDTGDNLAGLGYTRDGFLTAITNQYGDWYLASVGQQPALGNVDYIPTGGWSLQLFPHEGEGFVGYNATQGFVRFLVAAIARNEYREVVGVGLLYLGSFGGSDEAVELEEWSYDFPAEGGVQTAQLKGNKYSTYQIFDPSTWASVQRKSTTYEFIQDRIDIKVDPNTSTEPRESIVTIRTTSGKESSFKIRQEGQPKEDE